MTFDNAIIATGTEHPPAARHVAVGERGHLRRADPDPRAARFDPHRRRGRDRHGVRLRPARTTAWTSRSSSSSTARCPTRTPTSPRRSTKQYKKLGVNILDRAPVESIDDDGSKVTVTVKDNRTARPRNSRSTRCCRPSASRPASRASAWRRPASSSPSAAPSRSTTTCAPTSPHIYAIGDVTAKLQLAHVAEAQGVVAAETIAGAETLTLGDYRMMPRATFCQPQVASFGLTEQQARDEGYDVKVANFPFTANGKAHGLGDPTRLRQADRRHEVRRTARRPPDRPRRLRAAARADAGAEVGPHGQRAGPQRAHPPDAVARRCRRRSTASPAT